MMSSRKFMDRITNRDVVEKQATTIRKHNDLIREQREIIEIQSNAIDEFKVSVAELIEELMKLRNRNPPVKKVEEPKPDE